jgi:hypothetical protein
MADIVPVATIGAIQQSNLPERHKSHIREWYDRVMTKAESAKAPVLSVAHEAASVARADLTAAVVGIAMAVAEEKLGSLDFGARKDIPVDGLVAAAGAAGAIFFAGQEGGSFASEVARNVSSASVGILAYRKTGRHLGNAKLPPSTPAIHGEVEDPLLAYARNLDV